MVVARANVRDDKLLAATLDAVVVERPEPAEGAPQHLCLDKGYDNKGSREIARERSYVSHIRRIGEEKLDEAGEERHPARRWVVERTLAWLSKSRHTCALREEGGELPGAGQGALHPHLVPSSAPAIPFEIVS